MQSLDPYKDQHLDKEAQRKICPIGLFDSGLGGLTVLQKIQEALPYESLIYFGDTARLPYGNKSRETIIRYSIENTIFLIEKHIKILVIPCNTASAFAIQKLRQIFKIPVLGVIEPGAKKAVEVTRTGRIAVLGTRGTIQSGAYQAEILQRMPQATLFPLACPLFVPLVEEGFSDHAAARLIIQEYLKPIQGQNVDTILLGCTHYPILKDLIQEEMGSTVTIVDSASTCAEEAQTLLNALQLSSLESKAYTRYYVSDDPEKFRALAYRIFGMELENVREASTASLEEALKG